MVVVLYINVLMHEWLVGSNEVRFFSNMVSLYCQIFWNYYGVQAGIFLKDHINTLFVSQATSLTMLDKLALDFHEKEFQLPVHLVIKKW